MRPEVDFGRDHLLGSQLAITLAYGWSNVAPLNRQDTLRESLERHDDVPGAAAAAPVADPGRD